MAVTEEELRNVYLHQMSCLAPVPWNEAFRVPMDNVFTSLSTVNISQPHWGSKSLHDLVSVLHDDGVGIEDLFRFHGDRSPKSQHIVIEGEPGIGKTTLCHKLAYDWAKGTNSSLTSTSLTTYPNQACCLDSKTTSDIHRFRLVFFMPARRLEEASLLDCIYESLLPEDFIVTKEMLGSLLEKPDIQELVLFITDAYDELSSTNDQLKKLIERRIYSRSSVLITTRPTYANNVISYFDSGFVILGYPFLKRKEFIRKYVDETNIDIKIFRTLERNLLENDTICDLSRNPLYLWFLCMLVEENEGQLPETRTQLFDEVIELLLKKARLKFKISEEDCDGYFRCLCRLAFESQKKRKVHFNESLLKTFFPHRNTSMLGKLGFLAREMSSSRLRPSLLFTFTHKTIQEFLAANYLITLDPAERISFVHKRRKDSYWWTVWIFLSGLLQGDNDALDTHYRNAICKDLSSSVTSSSGLQADDRAHNTYHLGLQCLGESGLFATFKSLASLIVPTAFVYHVMACHYCLQGFVLAHSEGVPSNQPDLVVNGLDLEMYQMFDYKLLDGISSCKNLQSIAFAEVMSVNLLLQYLTKFCASPSLHLKHLYIYMSPVVHPDIHEVGFSLQELRRSYKSISSLESLVFKGSEKSMYKGAENIAQGLEMLLVLLLSNVGPNLKTLVLNEHKLSDMAIGALSSRLDMCTNLKNLYLEIVRFAPGQFELLMDRLSHVGKLTTLNLVYCQSETEDGVYVSVPKNIPDLIKICPMKELSFHSCNLKADTIGQILKNLEDNPCFHELEIVNDRLDKEVLDMLCKCIGKFERLSKITLCDVGLNAPFIPGLTESLKNTKSLTSLDLSSNDIGSTEAFVSLVDAISELQMLTNLKLDNCRIKDDHFIHLKPLFERIKLKHVSLIGNSVGSSSTGVQNILSVLELSHHLEKLSLTCVQFTPETGVDLAKALQGNSSLKQLNVLCHPTPGLISGESFKELYKKICELLPSLETFSTGFNTNIDQAHLWRKTDHAYYRSVCLETDVIVHQ